MAFEEQKKIIVLCTATMDQMEEGLISLVCECSEPGNEHLMRNLLDRIKGCDDIIVREAARLGMAVASKKALERLIYEEENK